jgi:histidinol-phosphate aminotransferase
MNSSLTSLREGFDALLIRLASRYRVETDQIIPFVDHADLLTSLLSHFANRNRKLIVAGYASPEVAIAADRAGLAVVEVVGASPFVNHPEDMIEAIGSRHDLVYLANPNWVTGANFSFNHLDRIVREVPDGCMIIDEKYHDFFGITGLPLLGTYDNLVILRSLSVGLVNGLEMGCFLGSPRATAECRQVLPWMKIRTRELRFLEDCLANQESAEQRLTESHDESLRLATDLVELEVQNRLTSADFILLRVADPARVGNYLATFGLPTENLQSYPGLENYLRYRIDRPDRNEQFLTAFRRMPSRYYQMDDVDRRAVMFHRVERPSQTQPGSERRIDLQRLIRAR